MKEKVGCKETSSLYEHRMHARTQSTHIQTEGEKEPKILDCLVGSYLLCSKYRCTEFQQDNLISISLLSVRNGAAIDST